MPHEKIFNDRNVNEYALVNWSDKDLTLLLENTVKRRAVPNLINHAPPFTTEEYLIMNSAISSATGRANKYGYWVKDIILRALDSDGEFDIRYRYDLAREILYNTSNLSEDETLIHRFHTVIRLNRLTANKFIKTLKRASRAVFGKDEW